MPQSLLAVVRQGGRWAVSADGEVMAVARRKRDAQALARDAAKTLRASGYDAQVATEPRSFAAEAPEPGETDAAGP